MPRQGVTLGLFELARLEQHLCERALSLAQMTVVFVRDVHADGVPERPLGRRRVTFDEADPAEDHTRPGGVAGRAGVQIEAPRLLQLGARLDEASLDAPQRAERMVRPRLREHAFAAMRTRGEEHLLGGIELEPKLE